MSSQLPLIAPPIAPTNPITAPVAPWVILMRFLLPLLLVIATGFGSYFIYDHIQIHNLVLAAGSPSGESYQLSRAIAQVVNTNHRNLRITVISTCGSAQNLALMATGKVELATAQADIPAGSTARTIAVLYKDLFQLVVKKNSGIASVADLAGRIITSQANSGEQQSLLAIAKHYGVNPEETAANGLNLQSIPCQPPLDNSFDAFEQNQADAVFRVRTLGNAYVTRAVHNWQGQLLPISQAKAMQISNPAFEYAQIPRGAYQGNPPIPNQDLPTVAVQRLLLASKKLSPKVVRQITQILDEHRRDIADQIPLEQAELRPLVASFSRPSPASGTGIPLHPGALAYYDRAKPTFFSFLLENGPAVVTLSTPVVAFLLWLWNQFRERLQKQQDLAEQYISLAIQQMAAEIEIEPELRQPILQQKQAELEQVFNQAAAALVTNRISQESFRTFNEAYTTTRAVLERRMAAASNELADRYIAKLISLLNPIPPSAIALQQEFNHILKEVEGSLTRQEISQESFRTFIEAYKMTRDLLSKSL
jgi:uncharacterized protein